MLRKMLRVMLMVFTLCFCVETPMTVQAVENEVIKNDETGIPDKGLYIHILDTLRKKKGDTFTKSEARKVTYLSASYYSGMRKIAVRSLKGIEYLENLESLNLEDNQIKDIALLKQLKKLKELYLANNKITDLSPLTDMESLESLSLGGNPVKDISPIVGLSNMKSLSLWDTKITSLSQVSTMVNLTYLRVASDKLENLNGLENLVNLEALYVQGKKITKLPNMKQLINLTDDGTFFWYTNISKKELLKKLPDVLSTNTLWLNEQVKMQKYYPAIFKVKKFSKKKTIGRKVKKIQGTVNPKVNVVLKVVLGKTIKKCKANAKGKFVLNKLNLKKYKGKRIRLESYVYSKVHGEKVVLKSIDFKVK